MPAIVRPILVDELPAWVRAVRTGFHMAPAGADELAAAAAHRAGAFEPGRWLAALDGERTVGTLRSFTTELTVPGGVIAADAVSGVTVTPTHRRQGLLTRMLAHDLDAARDRGEAVSILIASEYPIYGRYGYGPATQHATWVVDAAAARFEHGGTGDVELVEPEELRRLAPPVFDALRQRVPGAIARDDRFWDERLGIVAQPGATPWPGRAAVCRDARGRVTGYVRYRIEATWDERLPTATLHVDDLEATAPAAAARLWRWCCEVDWVRTVHAADRSVADPLPWFLADARHARQAHRSDLLWLRVLDPVTALTARRYGTDGRLVLEIVDDEGGYAGGRFAVDGGPDGATCARVRSAVDVTLTARALAAAYLGGARVHDLATAGLVRARTPAALARADAMFTSAVTPWCNTWF